jgi:hypothetical protein
MPRKATIGPAVYERVNELVKEGKTRPEAFAQVGQERGAQPGTVSANYYRTARSQGETGRRSSTNGRRRRRTTVTTRTRTPAQSTTRARSASPSAGSHASSNGGDLGALAAQIAALTQQLVEQIEERDARLRQALR